MSRVSWRCVLAAALLTPATSHAADPSAPGTPGQQFSGSVYDQGAPAGAQGFVRNAPLRQPPPRMLRRATRFHDMPSMPPPRTAEFDAMVFGNGGAPQQPAVYAAPAPVGPDPYAMRGAFVPAGAYPAPQFAARGSRYAAAHPQYAQGYGAAGYGAASPRRGGFFGGWGGGGAEGDAVNRWGGFYFGGMAGRGASSISRSWPGTDHWAAAGTAFGQSNDGLIYGGFGGFNYALGRMVLGVEGSIIASRFSKEVNAPAPSTVGSDPIRANYDMKQLYLVAGRAGFAMGDFLPYAKGGWAFANVTTYTRDSTGSGGLLHDANTSVLQNGPMVGVGVDYMVMRNVVVGLAYDYIKLRTGTHAVDHVNGNGTSVASPVFAKSDVNADMHVLVARAAFKLGPRN